MKDGLKRLSPGELPPMLGEIPDPPKELWVRGELPPFEARWLAVVGSRACTSYGRQAVAHLLEGLAGYPIVIVSGLAFGVDVCAHNAALNARLPTVAVPGSGLDWSVLYPRTHVALAKDILEAGGAHLSEFPPDTRAAEYTFPKRNRIMAGLCHATLVIEAKEKSGSLITARLTTEYNRELLVVPGSIFSPESRGAHQFLKLGATPVTEPADILRALGLTPNEDASRVRDDVSDEEARVLALLAEPLPRDELQRALGLSAQDANILLSTMEIKGLITEAFGSVRLAR